MVNAFLFRANKNKKSSYYLGKSPNLANSRFIKVILSQT